MRSGIGTRVGAVLLASALAVGGLVMGSAAQAAPGDQVSLAFDLGSFGPQKSGTGERKTFSVTNNGLESVTVDPAPLSAITAPFASITTTIMAGETIDPGESRTITVDYTAGAVGTTPSQAIVFTAVSVFDPSITGNFAFVLSGESIATDPASFEVTQPTGGLVDFGEAAVGSSVTRTIVVSNNGVRDLKFESSAISIAGTDGRAIPVTLVGAPFIIDVVPGESASFGIVFTPTVVGATTGALVIQGRQYSGDVVVATATRELDLVGAAAVAPTPSPTPTTGAGGGSGAGTGGAAAAGAVAGGVSGRQLASTGIDGVGGFVGGTVAVMILLAGIAAVATRRIQKRV